jgi:predicted transposase/invertase (TIGR01784 family)
LRVDWLDFFGHSSRKRPYDIKHLESKNPMLWKAYQLLDQLPLQIKKKSEKELYMLQKESMRFKNRYVQGVQQGIEQGIEQNQEKIVKNMLINNLSLELIAQCTEISLDEVKKYID